jgi:hypothetical protein
MFVHFSINVRVIAKKALLRHIQLKITFIGMFFKRYFAEYKMVWQIICDKLFRLLRLYISKAGYYGVLRICISVLEALPHYFLNECQMPCYIAVFPLQTIETDGLDSTVTRCSNDNYTTSEYT